MRLLEFVVFGAWVAKHKLIADKDAIRNKFLVGDLSMFCRLRYPVMMS